jgi:hypothetical protein
MELAYYFQSVEAYDILACKCIVSHKVITIPCEGGDHISYVFSKREGIDYPFDDYK